MRTITLIIIHCSDSPEGRNDTIEDIRRWHTKERKFKDVGYHFVIHLDGSIHHGRPISQIGAHCTNHNAHSIGICYIGGKTKDMKQAKDTRTDEQKEALLSLIKELKYQFPNAVIAGHKDFANKACPCFDASKEYKDL